MQIRKTFVAVLILLICLWLAGCSFPITIARARAMANSDFADNWEVFAQIADTANLRGNILSESLGIGAVRDIDIPEELAAAGINSIFADVNDRVIYFEYAEGIMWATGFGILYAADEPGLPEWYRLEPIEDRWYFYIVES